MVTRITPTAYRVILSAAKNLGSCVARRSFAAIRMSAHAGFLAQALLFVASIAAAAHAQQPSETPAKFIDLTYTLNDKTPYWPGENYLPFELKTIATLEKDGVLSKALSLPEHLGTHIDAPNHFEPNQPDVSEIPPEQLIGPGVVIDVSAQAEQNADYRLSVDDVKAWEAEHGQIPEGAIVMLNTGWSRFWDNYPRYKNQDVRGTMHFPGYSAEAARFLIGERNICGIGIDTLSIDYGKTQDFPVHHVVNGAGKYGLENVANLDQLPPRGFTLIVAPIKVEKGTGGPTRIFAVVQED